VSSVSEIDVDVSAPEGDSTGPPSKTRSATLAQWMTLFRRLARNKTALIGGIFIVMLIVIALAPSLFATHDPIREQNIANRFAEPSAEHWFGTDQLGRDILTRIAYGARVSLMIGLLGATGGMLCGVTLGTMAGFFGGTFDHLVMRVVDVMMSFPGILLAILIVSVLGPGTSNLIVALTIWFIPTFARISRGNVLSLKEMDFVESAKSLGASNSRVIMQHVLLNIMSPIIVYMTLSVATSILTAAGMGFLGLGVQPPTAEWGIMIRSQSPAAIRANVFLRLSAARSFVS